MTKKVKGRAAYPFTRFYWGDHALDTSHITPLEEGFLFRLYRQYYREFQGPLPNDRNELCKRVRARSTEDTEAVDRVIEEFFYIGEDGLLHHKRCDEELAHVGVLAEAASKGGKTRANQATRDGGRFVASGKGCIEAAPAVAGISTSASRADNQLRLEISPADIDVDKIREDVDINKDADADAYKNVDKIEKRNNGSSSVSVGHTTKVAAPPSSKPDKVGADTGDCSNPSCSIPPSSQEGQDVAAPCTDTMVPSIPPSVIEAHFLHDSTYTPQQGQEIAVQGRVTAVIPRRRDGYPEGKKQYAFFVSDKTYHLACEELSFQAGDRIGFKCKEAECGFGYDVDEWSIFKCEPELEAA